MHIIKVNAIDSTNSFLREMYRRNSKIPTTCVVAKQQLQGRGQRGTSWDTYPGLNLTFSVLFPRPKVVPETQFLISASVVTALVRVLETENIPKLKLKWPNDIMSANYKIGGILIENVILEHQIAASIIGIGLNVNQTEFPGLPSASSIKLVSGNHVFPDELLSRILPELETALEGISDRKAKEIMAEYKQKLFRKGIPSTFQLPDNTFFTGLIDDVSPIGKLVVRTASEDLKEFDLKEVRLCY